VCEGELCVRVKKKVGCVFSVDLNKIEALELGGDEDERRV
jgi:hypothetical protein